MNHLMIFGRRPSLKKRNARRRVQRTVARFGFDELERRIVLSGVPIETGNAFTLDPTQLPSPTSMAEIRWTTADGGNGHIYEVISQAMTWSEASTYAAGRGGYLATITSAGERAFVEGVIPGDYWSGYASERSLWLGGFQQRTAPNYSEPAGGWKWVTDEPWDFTNWYPGEPNNLGSEHALSMRLEGDYAARWNDLSETQVLRFIIEYEPPAPPSDVASSAGNGQVDLSWTAPAMFGSDSIADYVIQQSSDAGGSWTTFDDGLTNATSTTVTGLTNGTGYIFRVAAVNGVGQGEYSPVSSETRPMPPDIIVDLPDGISARDNASRTGSVRVVKQGLGTLVLDQVNTHSGGTLVEAGELVIRNPSAFGTGTLEILPGAKVTLDAGNRLVFISGLNLSPNSTLDLLTGAILLDAGSYDLGVIRSLITGARSSGTWSGPGITSSSIQPGSLREVGYHVRADGSLLVGYAAVGDANLDGFVNVQDLIALNAAGKYGSTGANTNWWEGDFNYDGFGNINDLIALLSSGLYGKPSYLPANPEAVGVSAASEVPLLAVFSPATLTSYAAPESQPETVPAVTPTPQAAEPRRIDEFTWAAIANQGETEKPTDGKVTRWRMVGR